MKQNRKDEVRYNINSYIRARRVKLVGDNVTVGDYPLSDALRLADSMNLDLIEINGSNPELSICKIADYQKFLYEKKKNEKKPKKVEVKELRLRPATDENDLNFKIKNAREWLTKGNLVKVTIFFKGREITHKELGYEILSKVITGLEDVATIDKEPTLEGPRLVLMVKPKSKK